MKEKFERIEKQKKIKVEERRIAKKFDVWELMANDIKDILDFLQVEPEDDKYTLDKKINAEEKPKSLFFIPAGESSPFRTQTMVPGGAKPGDKESVLSEDSDPIPEEPDEDDDDEEEKKEEE